MTSQQKSSSQDGRIITFYSFKGGTGRSMILANVAWILASAGKRVLAIDWDLEAPGLHRYFRPFLLDKDLSSSDGIIDFVTDYCAASMQKLDPITDTEPLPEGRPFQELPDFHTNRMARLSSSDESCSEGVRSKHLRGDSATLPSEWFWEKSDLLYYKMSLEWRFSSGGLLDFVPAGRQGASYATRVNSFNWQLFYEEYGGGHLIDSLRRRVKRDYDYVLVDSRTGVSDTSGICTIQLPDILAVCFTLNNQSIEGASRATESITRQRRVQDSKKIKQIEDELTVFPIPMRIDVGEQAKVNTRLELAQQRFAQFLNHVPQDKLSEYWADVGVLYVPAYSFEELLCAFADSPSSPSSILPACERITAKLTFGQVIKLGEYPSTQLRNEVLAAFQGSDRDEISVRFTVDPIQRAEGAIQRMTPEDQKEARRILTRMVFLVEAGKDTPIKVSERDLHPESQVATKLIDAGIIARHALESRPEEAYFEYANEVYLNNWNRLKDWLQENRPNLLRHQALRLAATEWERSGRKADYLLPGNKLTEAMLDREKYGPVEVDFLRTSSRRQLRFRLLRFTGVILLASLAAGAYLFSLQQQKKNDAAQVLAKASVLSDPLQSLLLAQTVSTYPQPTGGVEALRQIAAKPVPSVVLLGHTDSVLAALFDTGDRIVTASLDGTVRFWTSDKGRQLAVFEVLPKGNYAAGIDFNSAANAVAYASAEGEVGLLGPETGGFLDSPWAQPDVSLLSIAYRPDGQVLAIGDDKGRVHFTGAAGNQTLYVKGGMGGTVRSIAWGPSGQFFVAGGGDNAGVSVWDSETWKLGFHFDTGDVSSVAASPSGDLIAVATNESVTTWDPHSGRMLQKRTMKETPSAVALGAAGKLAAGTNVGKIYIWGGIMEETPVVLMGHNGRINSLRFSSDGSLVVSASSDGTARIWSLAPPSWHTNSWTSILQGFQQATTACLLPIAREQVLGEEAAVATARYTKCESDHGRTPLSGAVLAEVQARTTGSGVNF